MRLIHLSDLHIGKRVHEFSMLEDQKYILRQILEIVRMEQADGVLIAGDIYDKPLPSAEAVRLFDWFLTALAELGICVFAISGNHDSAERLAFGADLMSGRSVYFSPVYDGNVRRVKLQDAYGDLSVWLLPFLKPAVVRHALASEEISTCQDAVKAAVGRMEIDTGERNVLLAHQFVTGAMRCESEEILVGGIDQVDVSVFEGFDYTALGHLHSPQHVMREAVRYSGTPLKYSFSETEHEKSVTAVDLLEKGDVRIRVIPLKPLRDLRKIRGTYLEVTQRSFYQNMNTEDYIQITLTDEEDVPDGLQKLRIIYPNLMRLEYDNKRTRKDQEIQAAEDTGQKSELEWLAQFYELQNNSPMSEQQRSFAEKLIQDISDRAENGNGCEEK